MDKVRGVDFESLMEKWEKEWANRKWYDKVWDKVWFKCFYPLKPSEIRYKWTRFKSFFIRGKNGWSPMDTWGLDGYLARVIRDSLLHLQKNVHGYPCDLDEKTWDEYIGKMAWTFDAAVKIIESDYFLIRKEDFLKEDKYTLDIERYEETLQSCEKIGLKYGGHVMTLDEIRKYDEGWALFQKYYFGLWD